MDTARKIEIIVELCRAQLHANRESGMTSKLRGALDSIKRFQHDAEYEAEKLVKRIETEARPLLAEGVKAAHGSIDAYNGVVNDIVNFATDLKNSNGGELGNSEGGSKESPPRSSEVASS